MQREINLSRPLLAIGGTVLVLIVLFFIWDNLTYRPNRPAIPTLTAVPATTPTTSLGTPAAGITGTPTVPPTATPVAQTPTPETDPRGRILFLSDEGSGLIKRGRVFAMNLDGTGRRQASKDEERLYNHAKADLGWKSDRLYQAFVKNDQGGRAQIWVQFIQDKTSWQASRTGSGIAYSPAWQPGGELIAMVSTEGGEDDIYTLKMDGSGWRRLTGPNQVWDKHPAWSPDGQTIIWWSMQGTGHQQVWAMNLDGTGQRNISNSRYNDWDPVWVK